MVFNTGPYTDLPDNSILITANMQPETGFPSSHQLKSYVAFKSRLKLTARAVLSADAGLLVLSPSGSDKTQIFPFFGLRHFVVSPTAGNLIKLNTGAQLQTKASKSLTPSWRNRAHKL